MEQSTRFSLPYVAEAQARKHVTVNETFERLDALLHLTVISSTLSTQPASPKKGDAYILPNGASGSDWGAMDEEALAVYLENHWEQINPIEGMRAFEKASGKLLVFKENNWKSVSLELEDIASLKKLGINTQADDTNKFSVKSDAELLSHDDITPGSGDARKIINKAEAGKTASVVFQNNFSGRAEFGLTGDDNFHLKVSPDGSAFHEGMVINRTNGAISFPKGREDLPTFLGSSNSLQEYAKDDIISLSASLDTANKFNSATNQYQIPETGYYQLIIAQVLRSYSGVPDGFVKLQVRHNGVFPWQIPPGEVVLVDAIKDITTKTLSEVVFLQKDDVIDLQVNLALATDRVSFWAPTKLIIQRIN